MDGEIIMRFTETLSTGIVRDNLTKKEYNCEMRIDDKLLELLNELAEENQEFRKRTKELIAVSLDYPTINLDLIAEAIKSLRELIE